MKRQVLQSLPAAAPHLASYEKGSMIRFSSRNSSLPKKEFIKKLASKMGTNEEKASKWLDGVTDTLYDTFKEGQGVTLTGFGSFYLSQRRESTVFKFNPSQKLKKLLGWSSSYKGDQ